MQVFCFVRSHDESLERQVSTSTEVLIYDKPLGLTSLKLGTLLGFGENRNFLLKRVTRREKEREEERETDRARERERERERETETDRQIET